ncbi:MAG: hypothetical protein ACI30N_01080, partial [Muribaculaceae bacterium]
MKTVFPKNQRFYLNKRIFFLLLILLAFILTTKAEKSDKSETADIPLIHDITYDYHLFVHSDPTQLDCRGSLSFSVSLPKDTSRMIFERTRKHI